MELSTEFYDANNGQIQLTWCPGFKASVESWISNDISASCWACDIEHV